MERRWSSPQRRVLDDDAHDVAILPCPFRGSSCPSGNCEGTPRSWNAEGGLFVVERFERPLVVDARIQGFVADVGARPADRTARHERVARPVGPASRSVDVEPRVGHRRLRFLGPHRRAIPAAGRRRPRGGGRRRGPLDLSVRLREETRARGGPAVRPVNGLASGLRKAGPVQAPKACTTRAVSSRLRQSPRQARCGLRRRASCIRSGDGCPRFVRK